MIEFHDVCVCYEPNKRHPVRSLDGLSLQIARGDWVFLVGPSGAGKSSLLKLIYAGTKVQSGRVVVDGQDITGIARGEIPALRRKIGIVFQDFQLLNEKTAWENVAFTLRVIGAPQSVIVREVPRALETVGLTHRAEAFPHELSGGEQQRIAVARAIVNDPKILLADEPTGNLDPQTAREVGELLTKINFERGTTIVMATHDRSFVNELQRRVVRLKAGQIVSDENPGIYGKADEGAEETAPFQTPATHFSPARVEKPALETPLAVPILELPHIEAAPAEVAPIEAAPTPAVGKTLEIEPAPPLSAPIPLPVAGKWEEIAQETTVPSQPIPEPPKPKEFSPAPSPVVAARIPAVPIPKAESDTFSENTAIEDFPAPRPMARRIAPSNAPAPPPPSGHALDPNAQVVDPNLPVGSPENPIVQYD